MADSKNYFYFSSSVKNLLFENLSLSSEGGFVGLCIGVAFITFLYEAIKSLRHYLVIVLMRYRDDPDSSLSDPEEQNNIFSLSSHSSKRITFHCFQTVLYMLQLTIGYLIMLVIMSFNAWFMITVAITSGLWFYFHEYILSRKALVVPVEIPSANL